MARWEKSGSFGLLYFLGFLQMEILPQRKSIRLKNYDYSQEGAYFVTICTQNREEIFGEIINGKMVLNQMGEIVDQTIQETPKIRQNVQIDIYQIMPNHIHMIIIITDNSQHPTDPRPTLGNIVAYFKYESTKQINSTSVGAGYSRPINGSENRTGSENPTPTDQKYPKIFQRNYFEHIIRNEQELFKTRQYITLNPQMWDRDRNNPDSG